MQNLSKHVQFYRCLLLLRDTIHHLLLRRLLRSFSINNLQQHSITVYAAATFILTQLSICGLRFIIHNIYASFNFQLQNFDTK